MLFGDCILDQCPSFTHKSLCSLVNILAAPSQCIFLTNASFDLLLRSISVRGVLNNYNRNCYNHYHVVIAVDITNSLSPQLLLWTVTYICCFFYLCFNFFFGIVVIISLTLKRKHNVTVLKLTTHNKALFLSDLSQGNYTVCFGILQCYSKRISEATMLTKEQSCIVSVG